MRPTEHVLHLVTGWPAGLSVGRALELMVILAPEVCEEEENEREMQ